VNAAPSGQGATSVVEPGGPGSTQPILAVHGLTKSYEGQRALDGMDFEVRAGEIHALLGENGAGKSTLIKVVSGAIPFDAGRILLDGREVRPSDPADARRLGIAVVHQHGNLVPALTVAENILLGDRLPRRVGVLTDRRRMHRVVRDVLEQVQLDVRPDTPVSGLKPHQAGMVQVAKALHTKARLIILDEPTTAFTPAEVDVLFERLRSLAAQGTAFVYVSHRLAEVMEIADRMTVMREGKLVGTWRRHELDHDGLVAQLVGDEELAHRHSEDRQAREVARGEPILTIRGLRGPGVDGVDLTVHHREVLGLASLPGNGAEDIVRLLFGLTEREAGELELDGKRIAPGDPGAAKAAGFALIPKDRHAQAVLPGRPVRDNATIASTRRYRSDRVLRLMRRRIERQDTRRLIDELSIKTRGPEQDIATLSGGNQQKVVLGRWLLRDSRVFLFDDPCAGVDIQSKSEIYRIISGLAEQGAGVIVTSTELEELVRACHRVVVLFEGRIVGELVGDQITEQSILRLAFGPSEKGEEQAHGGRS
jgi:ABC-type sugar transport system ATPase subunit